MKILILNGPNLNLLSKRSKEDYGIKDLQQIEAIVKNEYPEIDFTFYQSNLEGELVTHIQSADDIYDGLIINPGGYSHTSVAIHDALELCKIPKIEVHLSHLAKREDFRQNLITAKKTNGYISGFSENGYLAAIYLIKKILNG
ncbi:MAG: type II 3-dehydroquinate dehydratase [Ignavibacteriaceae bacterium]